MRHYQLQVILATAKQEPLKSRPLWGKVAGVSLTEGGNSLSILDCPTTNAPTPTHHANKLRQIRKAIQIRKRVSPLRHPHGPTSPQRARLIVRTTQTKSHQIRGAIQPRKRVPPLRHPHGPTSPQRARLIVRTTQTKSHQIRGAIQPRKRVPPLRALTGPPLPKGRGLLYEPCLYLYRKQVIITTIKHSSYKALAREIAIVLIRAYSCPRKKRPSG